MNQDTGQMFMGDPEFLKALEKDLSKNIKTAQQSFMELKKEQFQELETMSLSERKAWAKRERKRLRRLEERQRLRNKKSKS